MEQIGKCGQSFDLCDPVPSNLKEKFCSLKVTELTQKCVL